jgi:hypothetical protein
MVIVPHPTPRVKFIGDILLNHRNQQFDTFSDVTYVSILHQMATIGI